MVFTEKISWLKQIHSEPNHLLIFFQMSNVMMEALHSSHQTAGAYFYFYISLNYSNDIFFPGTYVTPELATCHEYPGNLVGFGHLWTFFCIPKLEIGLVSPHVTVLMGIGTSYRTMCAFACKVPHIWIALSKYHQ